MYRWLIKNQEKFIALTASAVLASPLRTFAAVIDGGSITGIPGKFQSVTGAIQQIFNIVITVAGVAFVVLFLLGGIQYLGAAGNDEGTKKARQLMLDAVVGLGIVVVAWAVGLYVLNVLGLSNGSSLHLDPTTRVQ